jgi:deferrochelatase/peroxidase EfeB
MCSRIDGFRGADRGPTKRSGRRNPFGFHNGIATPDANDDALMRQLVWTPAGGTYMAVADPDAPRVLGAGSGCASRRA